MLRFCSQVTHNLPPLPSNPSTPPTTHTTEGPSKVKVHRHMSAHRKIAFSLLQTHFYSVYCSLKYTHTCTPVSAHITGRPSINKHKSNEKQHNTLQLGHFKHVQEELLTPIQQPSRDRANSCLPYPAEVHRRQERHGSALPFSQSFFGAWKSNQAQQGLLHWAADVEGEREERGEA